MFLGVDLGTSGIKVILMDGQGEIVGSDTQGLDVSRPQALWSEQAPEDWQSAMYAAMDSLAGQYDLKQVKAIGLSGQMHGATFLDSQNNVIRPAILWNDGRCEQECRALEQAVPEARQITGNIIMPGFTAPKAKWLQKHEPENFSAIHKVLLPKDYLRFILTGDYASDMSDAAGTMWLDVEKRAWSNTMLAASGLSQTHMPELFEGSDITGTLLPDLAEKWGMNPVPVIAGGGDNAAGAVGVGLVEPGQGMLSLGTSGVYFLVTDGFTSNPESAVHSFCHALPNTWHLMSVLLSAASCLQWFAESVAQKEVAELLQQLEDTQINLEEAAYFLPYLSGERTPHNNPSAKGNFFGLSHDSNQTNLTHCVLEGVSFAFADGVDALHASGKSAKEITLIGGGARSQYWRQMLADVLNLPVTYRKGGEVGPALGAARLAQLAVTDRGMISDICPVPEVVEVHQPDPLKAAMYAKRRDKFKQLYTQLKGLF